MRNFHTIKKNVAVPITALILAIASMANIAHADITCIRNRIRVRNNQVRLGNAITQVQSNECPRGFKEIVTNDQSLVGFAHVTSTPSITSFGGSKVSNVTVTNQGSGVFDVTFTGDFGSLDDVDSEEMRDRIVVLSNARATNYNVTNVSVNFASFLQITVRVYMFSSDATTQNNGDGLYLAIFQSPKSSS